MNICFVSTCQFNPYTGGIDMVCANIIPVLLNLGHNVVSCFSSKSNGAVIDGITHCQFPNSNMESEETITMFRSIIKEFQIDIIWNHSWKLEHHNLCVKSKQQAKLVYTHHICPGSALSEHKDNYDRLFVDKNKSIKKIIAATVKYPIGHYLRAKHFSSRYSKILHEVDAFTLLSNRYIIEMAKRLNTKDTSKLYSINNPINIEPIKPNAQERRKRQILYVGRMNWIQKRLDRLLKIWSIAQCKLETWELVILGDGPELSLYKKIAQDMRLKSISFKGSQPSKSYMLESSILCMTSSYEGLPMVLIEAQQAGCVPMAFDSFGALHDIIEDGKNGVIISPYNTKEYADKLIELCNSETKRSLMAQNGQKSVKKFSSASITEQWLKLFVEISNKN